MGILPSRQVGVPPKSFNHRAWTEVFALVLSWAVAMTTHIEIDRGRISSRNGATDPAQKRTFVPEKPRRKCARVNTTASHFDGMSKATWGDQMRSESVRR